MTPRVIIGSVAFIIWILGMIIEWKIKNWKDRTPIFAIVTSFFFLVVTLAYLLTAFVQNTWTPK